jgi:ABC-type transport system involved in multi-copper enzyme maturation permease subunit
MIRRILWKELLNNLRSLRLSLTFILLVLAMVIAGLVFAQKYHQMIEDHSRDVNVDLQGMRDRVESIDALAFHSHHLYKSPNPMRLCAEGREKYTPNSFEINITKINGMQNRGRVNFLRARLEDLDWTFIIGVIVSFAAIILTYDAISGEREDGTLKLMMSNSVSRASIILGKYLGGVVSLLIPLLAAIMLNLIIVLILGLNFTAAQWGRIGVICLISLVYISCFLMLGLFVSSVTRNSATSLVILLFLWTIFIAIVPSSGRIVAGKMQKVTSGRIVGKRMGDVWHEVLARYPPDTMNWSGRPKRPVPDQVIRRGKATWEVAEDRDQIRGDHRREMVQQLKLAQNLMRVSPMTTYTFLCEAVAGTGSSRFESFMSQVKRFRDEWREWIFSEDKKDEDSLHILSAERGHYSYSQKEPDFGHLPRFSEKLPSLRDSLQSGSLDLSLLILLNVLLFMASYLVFMRYDVR